jgi:Arylamine N-acetyltransferase
MGNKAFELDAYLARLNYSGVVHPTEEGLEALHRAHVYTIPFENFDILLGRGISLEPATLCDKLVHRGRGGVSLRAQWLVSYGPPGRWLRGARPSGTGAPG